MNLFKNNILNYFILFAISVLSLNHEDHNFYPGGDNSLFWAFNYIFEYNKNALDNITFIYGPLAFLRQAVCYGNLIMVTCLFQIALKFIYGFCLFKLGKLLDVSRNLIFLLFVISCLTRFGAEVYIQLPVILFLVIYHLESKTKWLVCAALLTALGYYIKCSIGAGCALVQIGFFAYGSLIEKKINYKLCLRLLLLNCVSILVIGFIIFRKLSPVFGSVNIYFHNIIAYSGTSSAYNGPDNVYLLGLFGVSSIAVFFINKKTEFRLFWLMALIILYGGYIHGITRMDNPHYINYLAYQYALAVTVGLFYRSYSKYTYPVLTLAFFSFYFNLTNKWDYGEYGLTLHNGAKNFYDYVVHRDSTKKIAYANSLARLVNSDLKINNKEALTELNKGSVDFFPWDMGFVEANHFTNWKPRPYLQNLLMLSYFDKKTADYFGSKEAPDHLIWHACLPADSTFFDSFDYSYQLTNQFRSNVSIFSNYKVFGHSDIQLYLKKTTSPLRTKVENSGTGILIKNNEWVRLPDTKGILGCSVKYNFNIMRDLKKLIYRDDEFYLEYKTVQNEIIKHRFWPNDADDFLWLSPYIRSPFHIGAYKKIKEIRFSNTNNNLLHDGNILLQFKTLKIQTLEPDSLDLSGLYKWFNS